MGTFLIKNKKARFVSGFFIFLMIVIGAAYWGYTLLQKQVAVRFLRIADDEFYPSVMAINRLSTEKIINYESNPDDFIERISEEKSKSLNAVKIVNGAKNFQSGVEPTVYVAPAHILLNFFYKEAAGTVKKYDDYLNYRQKIANEIKGIKASVGKIINSETNCRDGDISQTVNCLSEVKQSANESLISIEETLTPLDMAEFKTNASWYIKNVVESCEKLISAAQLRQNDSYEQALKGLNEKLLVYPENIGDVNKIYFNKLHDDFLRLKDHVYMAQDELEKAGNNLGVFILQLPPIEW